MSDTWMLRFLYRTTFGRVILKLLVQPGVSKAVGGYLSSGASKWLVSYYIRKHNIDMNDIEIPRGGFSSFNDFFTRKRKTICHEQAENYLISPCDGFLTAVNICKNTVFDIKHTKFSLEDLLEDNKLAERFWNGTALIFRLTPANYHRYCHVADGKIVRTKRIAGKLHCVRPIAVRTIPVYTQNSREYQVVRTEKSGLLIQMEIGALLVGKIQNHKKKSEAHEVQAAVEKGYFEFGGSTIIVLLQKDTICFNEKLYERQNSIEEIPVRMGEVIAEIRCDNQ